MLLTLISPLANAHGQLVRDLEQRLQAWEGRGGFKGDTQRVGDVLLTHLPPLLPVSTADLILFYSIQIYI